MKKKKDIKFYILIISYLLLSYSMFNDYLTIDSVDMLTTSIPTVALETTTLSIILFSFLLYFYKIRKEILYIITYILLTIITIFTLFETYIIYTEFSTEFIHLNIGFYIYLFHFILLIITLFIKKSNPIKKLSDDDNSYKQFKEDFNENNYLLGNLILGVKGVPYSDLSLLTNDVKNNTISIHYKDNQNVKTYRFLKKNISSINFKNRIIVDELEKKAYQDVDLDTANYLLITAVFGTTMIAHNIGNSILNPLMGEYRKCSYTGIYHIIIIFKDNSKIEFESKTDPAKFISTLNL